MCVVYMPVRSGSQIPSSSNPSGNQTRSLSEAQSLSQNQRRDSLLGITCSQREKIHKAGSGHDESIPLWMTAFPSSAPVALLGDGKERERNKRTRSAHTHDNNKPNDPPGLSQKSGTLLPNHAIPDVLSKGHYYRDLFGRGASDLMVDISAAESTNRKRRTTSLQLSQGCQCCARNPSPVVKTRDLRQHSLRSVSFAPPPVFEPDTNPPATFHIFTFYCLPSDTRPHARLFPMALSRARSDLLAQLQGQELHVPDLRLILNHWPIDINPQIEAVRASVPRRLLRWV